MFSGDSVHTLDPKNRVFVPKRFQSELGRDENGQQVAVLTRGFEGCLFLYSKAGYDKVLARLETAPFGGPELRAMQRMFFSNVHATPLDGSGRILIPEKLRNLAGIQREVVMVGVADRAEIWDRARWERFEEENDERFDALDEVLLGPKASGARGAHGPRDGGGNGET